MTASSLFFFAKCLDHLPQQEQLVLFIITQSDMQINLPFRPAAQNTGRAPVSMSRCAAFGRSAPQYCKNPCVRTNTGVLGGSPDSLLPVLETQAIGVRDGRIPIDTDESNGTAGRGWRCRAACPLSRINRSKAEALLYPG